MGVATTSLVRLDDGVNEDLATFRNRRELERTEAASSDEPRAVERLGAPLHAPRHPRPASGDQGAVAGGSVRL